MRNNQWGLKPLGTAVSDVDDLTDWHDRGCRGWSCPAPPRHFSPIKRLWETLLKCAVPFPLMPQSWAKMRRLAPLNLCPLAVVLSAMLASSRCLLHFMEGFADFWLTTCGCVCFYISLSAFCVYRVAEETQNIFSREMSWCVSGLPVSSMGNKMQDALSPRGMLGNVAHWSS